MDTNKNNQTISTKCQYKIPASNPKWWLFVKWYANTRHKPTAKNAVPIITCTIIVIVRAPYPLPPLSFQKGSDYVINQ
jgi:hypothetical protein